MKQTELRQINMRGIKSLGLSVLIALTALTALVSCGEEQPKVGEVTIIPMGSAGSGCPTSDNSKVTVKPFGTASNIAGVRIQYEDLLIEKNTNTTSKDSRKFCEVKFKLRTNDAWQFTIERSMWLGTLRMYPEHRLDIDYSQRIGSGATIDSKVTHGVGSKKTEKLRLTTNELKEVWSPCADTPLISVKSALKLSGDMRESDNVFDLTPPGSQTLLLRWRKC